MKATYWLLAGALGLQSPAFAGTIILLITNNPLTGAPGDQLTCYAQATNEAAATQYLNSESFTLTGTPFTFGAFDASAFLIQWPLFLAPGQTVGPQAIFSFTIPAGTSPGLYAGIFNILGGPAEFDQNLIGWAAFEVDVTSTVPEPANGGMIAIALGALSFAALRRRRQT